MIHSFLLIGQSNMAGRGCVREVAPIHDEHIKTLKNGRWQNMYEPLHADRFFAGIGPGPSFAACWRRDHGEEEIGLIPCADGGSSVVEWLPGTALFDHAVMQAKLAQRISTIDGILWHQGETDCDMDRLPQYEQRLGTVVSALRDQLGLPEVPFLLGGLGDYLPSCPLHDYFVHGPELTQHLRHFAQTHEHCLFVTAEGLTPNPDLLHFNAKSQRIFGARYYAAYAAGASVEAPVPGEEEILKACSDYQEMPAEEKAERLRQQWKEGQLTKQEYTFQMDNLIRSM